MPIIVQKVAEVNKTTEPDLVELAGFHAYQHYDDADIVKVNGKNYRVIDLEYSWPAV
jgi:hypothetical protein